jgi:citrate lyase gamma subunit
MRARFLTWLAILALPVLPSLARSAEPTKPTLVVRISSIDDLFANVKYLAALGGHEEEAKQFDGLIKSKIGPKGLDGIDTKRPLGVYATLDANANPENSTAVVLVPVSDEKAFLSLLESLGAKASKEDDGIYAVSHPSMPLPIPIYLRFANQYANITVRDKAALGADQLLAPDAALPAEQPSTLSAFIRLADIPSAVKQIVIAQVETKLSDLEDAKPEGETEAQHALGVQAAKEMIGTLSSLLKDGGELGLRLDIDRKAHQFVAEFMVNGKPDSTLAANIASLGKRQSLFAGLHDEESAFTGLVHVALPKSLHKPLERVLDEAISKELEKEKDAAKRAQMAGILKAINPTLKAAELDAAVNLRGPTEDGHYAFVAAVKVKDGEAIEEKLREAVKDLPEAERAKIKLDDQSAGEHKIHRLNLQDSMDADSRKVLGSNPFYLTIRSDAVLVAGGQGGIDLLKEAAEAEAAAAPIIDVRVSAARIAPLVNKDAKLDISAIKEKAFGDAGKDKIHFKVEGGKALRVNITVDAPVVKFFSLLDKEKKEKD